MVPQEYVIKYQLASARSLTTENYLKVPGFIGFRKKPGNLFINQETRQVHFVDDKTNAWRTTVKKKPASLLKLVKNNFHLFPKAGAGEK